MTATWCDLVPHEAGGFICTRCQRRAKRISKRLCKLMPVKAIPGCPLGEILSRLTPAGVERLQQCREAKCGLMLQVEDSIRCVGMPGSKCQWIAEWAKRLNDPEWVCPHWKEIKACASRQ